MDERIAMFKNIVEELIPFNKFIGVQLVEVKEGFVKLKVPFKPELVGNPMLNALHGGLISTVMDTAGGAAGMTTLTSFEDRISTIDMRVDYLRPGQAKDLIVEGKITRSGNRIVATAMKAYHPEEELSLIAEGRGVYNVKRN
ncbi:MAG: hotdog fold thioesterase [Chitinophagales bacterium]